MQRPVILLLASIAAGIVAADGLFYRASVAVPPWLGIGLWGLAVLLAVMLFVLHRRQSRRSPFHSGLLFVALSACFFALLGFARYAGYAENVQEAWSQMDFPPENRGNPDEFDYRRWRWVQGDRADRNSSAAGDESSSAGLVGRARALRNRLLLSLEAASLEPQQLAIVSAITLGDRSSLTTETRDLYAAAGASHLLALSGLHLGIIVGAFVTLLSTRLFLSRWRWPLALLVVLFIWGYAFVAGLPPSLVRASLMTSLLVLMSCVHRSRQGVNALLVTILLMLLVRPVYLFDVGAQLSCLAVAGILLCYQPFIQWCYRYWRFALFRLDRYHLLWPFKLLAVSICAQLFTWPLVFYYFHQYPLYGAFFSIILVPLTTLLVYGALCVMVLGLFWAQGAVWLGIFVGWLVSAQLRIMEVETSLPGAVIPEFWSRKAEPQLVIYHNRACPALHLIASPEQSWLLLPLPERADSGLTYIARSFWKRRLTAEPQVLQNRKSIVVEGLRAVMINDDQEWNELKTRTNKTIEVDVLWITKGFRGAQLKTLKDTFQPRLLVLDASLAKWQRRALATEAQSVGWKVYDVAEQGAMKIKTQETHPRTHPPRPTPHPPCKGGGGH